MSKNKISKIAEEKAFDYQRGLGMIDSICDDHIVARRMGFYDGFIAGYKLHEANTPLPEDTVIFQKGVEEGKRLMMEGAMEGEVENAFLGIVYLRKNLVDEGYSAEDKVRVIIVKED